MTVEEKLTKRLSLFPSAEKEKLKRTLGEYLLVKKDVQAIKEPIEVENIVASLREAHSIVENGNLSANTRKKAMIDCIRLYCKIVTTEKKDELIECWNHLLDERLLKRILEGVVGTITTTKEDYNMVVGVIKAYYDLNKRLIEDVLNPSLVENENIWAYENLESSIMLEELDNIDNDRLVKILNASKKISLDYIIALYNSSKMVCQLSKIDEQLAEIEEYLSTLSSKEAISKIVKILKVGTATTAYETQKKEKVSSLKKELNKFNCLILDVKR